MNGSQPCWTSTPKETCPPSLSSLNCWMPRLTASQLTYRTGVKRSCLASETPEFNQGATDGEPRATGPQATFLAPRTPPRRIRPHLIAPGNQPTATMGTGTVLLTVRALLQSQSDPVVPPPRVGDGHLSATPLPVTETIAGIGRLDLTTLDAGAVTRTGRGHAAPTTIGTGRLDPATLDTGAIMGTGRGQTGPTTTADVTPATSTETGGPGP